jgi:hypothetical protein
VAQAVERQAGEAVGLRPSQEHAAHRIGPQALTVGPAEHQPGIDEAGANQQPLLELAAMLAQRQHHPETTGVEVDVGPSQAQRLASAHPGGLRWAPPPLRFGTLAPSLRTPG